MRLLGALIALLASATVLGSEVRVEQLRMWPAPDHTRLVFDLSAPAEHRIFTLESPDRVVIDLIAARLAARLVNDGSPRNLVARIRSGAREDGALRVVLDLRQQVRPKSFVLKPNSAYGDRLVVDLFPAEAGEAPRAVKTDPGTSGALRPVVVAIDPGHGGDDPGAIGPRGTREKDVVYAIARHLERLIERERGMEPVMLRRGDYYVGLRKRMELARERRADLFISVHADAFRDPRVGGSAVYMLSRNGASSEAARWLAERENASDRVGGVSLEDKDHLLAAVLLDLSQTAALNASAAAGRRVLGELGSVNRLHKKHVERAGFLVLKSPDVPSILVETGFISNPEEERKLRDPEHQQALARAIMRGIRAYFERNAPPGTLLAARRHVISRGDTLSELAQRYRVPVDRLRSANGLADDRLRVGQVLLIPGA